jgi:hypothetical protein
MEVPAASVFREMVWKKGTSVSKDRAPSIFRKESTLQRNSLAPFSGSWCCSRNVPAFRKKCFPSFSEWFKHFRETRFLHLQGDGVL